MQYILSELEFQELQDKAMGYDDIVAVFDGYECDCKRLEDLDNRNRQLVTDMRAML